MIKCAHDWVIEDTEKQQYLANITKTSSDIL